jgi:electron transport complex protein RnfC
MRKIFGFHGGIHPPERKHPSADAPIAFAGVPPQLVLPLSQHIGAPATPVVSVGDEVLKGQLVAAACGLVSAPVHAPSSGIVAAIGDRQVAHASGLSAPCIVIDTDGRDQWLDLAGEPDYTRVERRDLVARIREAGIAGMGGAGFPTAVKLSPGQNTPIETLIINGTECEPYITADDRLMRERADRIVAGAQILAYLVSPAETLIGIEDNKPEALAALRAAVAGTAIEVVEFPTKYPSGGEKQLIEILTGKQVPSGALPAAIGVLCQNPGTAVAVHDAVVLGRPLISRITTVTGEAILHPQNFEVLLGTPVSYLLEKAGCRGDASDRLIMGGPMMGFTLPDPQVPVVKTTNCLLAPTAAELPVPPPAQACIRCGMCAQACPASLLPQQLFWFAQGKEYEKLEQHNLFDCIECGACSWVCPSNIPLVQYYRASKAEIVQIRVDNEKAEHSRLRFEARQQRLEREDAEKEAKRAARKLAAEARAQEQIKQGEPVEDPIKAAIERAKARKAAQAISSPEPAVDLDRLEQAVVTIGKRLATANARLEQARAEGSELVAALQAGADKTRAKLEAAERELSEQRAAGANVATTGTGPDDPARAAIARAMAARAAEESTDPAEKSRLQVEKLEQRLRTTQQRLLQGREAGEDEKVIAALTATVARLEEKIATARDQLHQVEAS